MLGASVTVAEPATSALHAALGPVVLAIGSTPNTALAEAIGLDLAPAADDDVHMVDEDGDKFLAYFSRAGVLSGVVGAGRAGAVMKMRAAIAALTPVTDLLAGPS